MIHASVDLPSEWVGVDESGLRGLQRVIRDIDEQPEPVLILHAPTGAGKTYGLRLWAEKHSQGSLRERKGLLVVSPTNALAAEIFESLGTHLPAERNIHLWTAQQVRDRHGNLHRHQALGADLQDAACIVSNPDTIHRFTNHAYDTRAEKGQASNLRPATSFLDTVGLIAIDEYHAYDDQLLASLLLLVAQISRRDAPPKVVFMSATESETLPTLLERLKLSYRVHDEPRLSEGKGGAKIRHDIRLTITNEPIEQALPKATPVEKTLFVFDAFADSLRALHRLPASIPRGDHGVVTVTGRDTNLRSQGEVVGQAKWNLAPLLIGTSKLDVGLNIPDIRHYHMQLGRNIQQAWQRFGRAGRDGPCRVTLHVQSISDDTLGQFFPIRDRDGLDKLLAAILGDASQNTRRVQEWMARYLAFYHAQTRPQHGHRLVAIDDIADSHPVAAKVYHQTLAILRFDAAGARLTGRHPSDWTEERWSKAIRLALSSPRSQHLQVEVNYPRFHSDEQTSLDNLVFVLRWTLHERTETDGRVIFRVERLHDKPEDVVLHYPLFGSEQRPLKVRGMFAHPDDWRALTRSLATFPGVGTHKTFRETLAEWLQHIGPSVIPPLEAIHDDAFI